MSVAELKTTGPRIEDDPYYEERVDLAAAFRMAARHNMHEAVANHFSLAVSDDGSKFLMNPCGRHFSRVRASELLLLDANDPTTMDQPNAPDPTAWCIHSSLHRNSPQARCLLHTHSKYALALSCLKDPAMLSIDQNTARYHGRIAYDDGFDGMGLGDEGERLGTLLGNKAVMMMGNHGVLMTASAVGHAFDELYYFEKACETLVTAYSTGKELSVLSDEIAEKTAQQWQSYPGLWENHWNALKEILDEEEPDYRT